MGTFRVTLEIGDPGGQSFEEVEALVDSGATYTFIPRSVLGALDVRPHRTMSFQMEDGTRIQRDFGRTWLKLDGEEEVSPVIFGDDEVTPLLGAVTLEIFGLGIDSVNTRLVPVTALA